MIVRPAMLGIAILIVFEGCMANGSRVRSIEGPSQPQQIESPSSITSSENNILYPKSFSPADGEIVLATHHSPLDGAERAKSDGGMGLVRMATEPALESTVQRTPESHSPASVFPIDLPTAFRLAHAENPQIALAQELVRQSQIEHQQSQALWLPSLRAGVHWNKHEGPLVDTTGAVRDVSRGSLYAGAGAAAVGGGSPAIPGIAANFHLADALFQPLIAQQRWGARESAATAAHHNTLLEVAIAYTDLLRSAQEVAIAIDLRDKVSELSRITEAYAKTGQGLQGDADRMRVELGLREMDLRRMIESQALASSRLAQLLRLNSCVRLEPTDAQLTPLSVTISSCDCCELVAQAMTNRPELRQSKYLVGEAIERLRRERYSPLVPSLLLGASYGGFGGGRGDAISNFDDRFDLDATAFWEVRNLGVGERTAREGANSRLRQAKLQELAVLDLVARETVDAWTQVRQRGEQIDTAKHLVKYAIDSYEHNYVRVQHGQGLPIESLQSVQALLLARREYLRAIVDYNTAQFTLQRALGWPPSFENN